MSQPRRYDLHEILVEILGSRNVYYQPPATVKMQYPCIVYGLDDLTVRHANDGLYSRKTRYQVTAMYKDPDSDLPHQIASIPYASFDTQFVSDGLIHSVLSLYF